ncbi:phosphatase PAP2 family protein [Rossellomorea aquimaris]|uniref:Phosphatase PAP2 family protein n=1 Tax=Rossellomorea aquimaris TaxID=189382 RepID=A0A5D4TID7_9BACI|nr:phosphatase PAP2 family protein [Rossellomorea aquimaris]
MDTFHGFFIFTRNGGILLKPEQQEVKKAGFPVLLILIGFVISGLFIYGFSEIAEGLLENEVKTFDDAIIDFFISIESSGLDQFMVFITELGSVWFITTASIITIGVLWFKFKDKWGILFFILAIGAGGLLTKLLKTFYERGRPSINPEIDAVGFSFPSGHSMGSLIFYGFLIYLVVRSSLSLAAKWTLSTIAALLFVSIGISRIYLGAHFPTDVLAGQLAGGFWLILCILALEYVNWQSRSEVRPIKATREFFSEIF